MLNQTCDVTHFRDSRVIVQVLKAKYPDMFLLTQEVKIHAVLYWVYSFCQYDNVLQDLLHGRVLFRS